ncbi:MAG: efflux RND transporter periplasmic adaptor subunit [Acidobacteriota bacterium]|jgi:Cu(I)/Ag(I) efflux system membrane fusion protein|nr:efflux RND transporter periplasmic adaptor subunit [Acidobacteriota bacterium]
MKNFILGFLAPVILLAVGGAIYMKLGGGLHGIGTGAGAGQTAKAKKVRYHCPMHPTFISDDPKTPCPICGMTLVPIGGESEYSAEPDPVPGYAHVVLTPERIQTMGVTTAEAKRMRFARQLRTYGRVAYDQTRVRQVRTKFEGYIEELYADYIGKLVKKGDPLFAIYSPELLATQNEFLLALRAREQTPATKGGAASAGRIDLVAAARQRLALWDIGEKEIDEIERTRRPVRALTIYSPVSGYVIAKTAYQGMQASPADSMYDIADFSVVWVLADIYEANLTRIHTGQRVVVTLPYQPGKSWSGHISWVDPTLDPESRTARARIEIANPGNELKPEMYAEVEIEDAGGSGVAVPGEAIVSTGERDLVFVDKGEGVFEPREVTVGVRVGDFREIRSGLSEGEKVVVGANFLLDSESRLQSSISGGGK